jgi:LPS sulfotransferase NodH
VGARSGLAEPALSYLICATPRSGSTLLCAALDDTGIAGHPEKHFEVLLETGRPGQPRDYFQRSNDPEIWALLDGDVPAPEGAELNDPDGLSRNDPTIVM